MMTRISSRGEKATRAGFGEAFLEIGKTDSKVVALCADLTESVGMKKFAEHFPNRFFNVGIAEAHMTSMAAGFATAGYIPFTGTFANFATGRSFDQVRQSVCYSEKNVKICASHAGLTLGEDGATHQILEDIGLMRSLPHMTVVVPADFSETKRATAAIHKFHGPVYFRFGRPSIPDFTPDSIPFEIGKSITLKEGNDVTIIACGVMVWRALQAAYLLEDKGVSARVINMHTIKPLDTNAVLAAASETGAIVTAEEHQINTGLGDLIANFCSRYKPIPIEMIAVEDKFGESGTANQLLEKYGLTAERIVEKALKALQRKRN
ncbi:MAG: transketolase family protein [Chloroherpetonaceae bacterium]|nr:transketolase family protein [Chloroherpetonaceae bacterium]